MENVPNKTLTAILKDRLMSLKQDVTPQDIKEAEKITQANYRTITRYLCGQVANTETATQLVEFFSTKINDRAKRVNVSFPAPVLA